MNFVVSSNLSLILAARGKGDWKDSNTYYKKKSLLEEYLTFIEKYYEI